LSRDPETLRQNAQELTAVLGNDRWKGQPALLSRDPETLRQNAQELTSILGNDKWKGQPALLSRDPETLRQNAQELTAVLGNDRWKGQPALLSLNPETIVKSVRALRSLGIEPSFSLTNLMLLGTTLGLKREKAEYIRREILGHKEVHLYHDKISLAELEQLTPEQKETERREIEEFADFIQRRPRLLVKSLSTLERQKDKLQQLYRRR
ncbi:MAG: hypothetical protein HY974_02640, partial [Candidatus Kerfeldbacteria bacterium]|nr:hypothetical protein [Candidatus Kerfeldbacteria bacterium]